MTVRIVRRLLRWTTRIVTAFLVLLALTVVVGRGLVQEVARFHPDIEQWLSREAGMTIRFGAVRGEWTKAIPELFFSNVTLQGSTGAAAVEASHIAISLNLARSLQHLTPGIGVRVQGLRLNAQCEALACGIAGLQTVSDATSRNPLSLPFLLSAKPRITLEDSRIRVEGLYGRPSDIHVPLLRLWWDTQSGWASGGLLMESADRLALDLVARIDVADSGRLRTLVYLQSEQNDAMSWVPGALAESLPFAASGGKGRSRAWLRIDESGLSSATLDLDWHDIMLRSGADTSIALRNVGGQFHWARTGRGQWTIAARQLRLAGTDFSWRPSSVLLESTLDGHDRRYRLRLADARFQGNFRALLGGVPESRPLRQWLLGLQPVGRIQDVDVRVVERSGQWHWLGGRMSLQDLEWQAWETLPGVRRLTATLWLEPSALWIELDTRDAVLDYPSMLRSPITLSRLHGVLAIDWTTDDFRLSSGVINAVTPDLSAFTRLHLRIPRTSIGDPGNLSLQVTLRNGDASEVHRYLPAALISPPLLGWLDGAIKGGELQQGDILVNGTLAATGNPLDTSVMLGFMVRDARLQFLPEWQQPVEELVGDVIVDNGEVLAEIVSGRYFGLLLEAGEVRTYRDPASGALHLGVGVRARGDASGALPILRETPLGSTLGRPLSGLVAQGRIQANVSLDAPLEADTKGLRGSVEVTLPAGRVEWPAYRLILDDLSLDMTYDLARAGVRGRATADFLGSPVHARMSMQGKQRQPVTRLSVKGNTSVAALGQWLQWPLERVATGKSAWMLDVDFHAASSQRSSRVVLSSDLDGIALDLPPPFGKQESEKVALKVGGSLAGREATHTLRYGDRWSAVWQLDDSRVSRLGVHVGPDDAVLPPGGRVISGHLPSIDVDEWSSVLRRWYGETDAPAGWLMLADYAGSRIHVSGLTVGGVDLGSLDMGLDRFDDTMALTVVGDRLKGRIDAPMAWLERPDQRSRSVPVMVNVDRLVLPARGGPDDLSSAQGSPDKSMPAPEDATGSSLDPSVLPLASVRIDELRLGDESYGRYAVDMTPITDGVRLDKVEFDLKTIRFNGSGSWRRDSGASRTSLTGDGRAGNVAEVMSGFGYAPSMTSRSATLSAEVDWKGAPWQFAVDQVHGSLTATVENGKFLTVDNNAARRVWGFLNFRTWMRRMQLEFDDIASSEMTYNKVDGRFQLGQNRLSVETLRIDSPSLDMRMQGELDLSARSVDMVWFVTIPVTRNLMLPAAVVGGLPGAATAFVVDRVLGKQIDRLTTLTYDVKGPFDSPVMEVRTPL
jgi:uncharacterized protein (TIGR02099 family)